MTVTRKKYQREKAIKRMEELNIEVKVINDFKKGHLYMSCFTGRSHINVRLSQDGFLNTVRELEREFDLLIYYCMPLKFGDNSVFAFLFVSGIDNTECKKCSKIGECEYFDYWRFDDDLLFTYCYNKTIPEFSEFGSVVFKEVNGVLIRIG